MTKTLFIQTLVALSAVCFQAQATPVKIDKTIRYGKLANGMSYYIRHNAQTKGIADFYFAQRVGSILEEPRQRGLAHFLEHMAFNGTVHFPGTDSRPGIVKWCESVGIKFGTNLNAYTSVDRTVYNISAAPVKREGIIDSCLLIMHDWSHSLLLEDKEIDKERGVVQEEWRSRRAGMAMQRLAEEAMPIIYQGSKYADSMPIGDMGIVMNFPYQDLRDYYHKWYRPDLQAVIVVGDIDVDRMEKKIRELFGGIPMPRNAASRPIFPVPDNERMIVHTAVDKEQPTVNFSLYMKRDVTPMDKRASVENYKDGYLTSLVRMMLNDRLDELTQDSGTPLISASVGDGHFFLANTKDAFEISGVFKEGRVEEGIQAVVGAVQQARQTGFTAAELERGKAVLMNYAKVDYEDRNDRRNADFVEQCVENFLEGEPIIAPEDELELVQALDKTVTIADANRMAQEIITNKNEVATLYAPDKAGVTLPSHDRIRQIVAQAQKSSYAPYAEKAIAEKLVAHLPTPGSIVREKPYKYGYTEITLSNGMRVYAKKTDFETDEILMNVFSKGGKDMYANQDMPNLTYLISGATAGGIGDFTATGLEKRLAGNTADLMPFINDETEGMKGSATKKDLETLFQLAYLYFTAPRRDTAAFNNLMDQQKEFLANACVNPLIAYNDTLHATAYGTDRLESMSQDKLRRVSYDRVMQIYKERFGNAADFSLILTGNIDMDSLRPLLCQYMASLPSTGEREDVGRLGARLRDGKITKKFIKSQKTPSTITTIVIKGTMPYSDRNDLLMDAIGQLLRMAYTDKVREDKGGAYNVEVNGSLERHPRNEALLRIAFRTDPKKYDKIIPIIYQQLNLLAKQGPSQADLDKVKAYELKVYHQVLRMNNYWEYVVYNDLYNGVDLDTNFSNIVKETTRDDIKSVLANLLAQGNQIEVTMTSN